MAAVCPPAASGAASGLLGCGGVIGGFCGRVGGCGVPMGQQPLGFVVGEGDGVATLVLPESVGVGDAHRGQLLWSRGWRSGVRVRALRMAARAATPSLLDLSAWQWVWTGARLA